MRISDWSSDVCSSDLELRDLSFDTISGAGPNGAVVHYRASEKTNRKLEPGQLYLVDSGGQYPDGTTDVTRTVAIGEPTAEMRDRFTRVLRSEEHTSELQSLMRISYAVFCLKKKKNNT